MSVKDMLDAADEVLAGTLALLSANHIIRAATRCMLSDNQIERAAGVRLCKLAADELHAAKACLGVDDANVRQSMRLLESMAVVADGIEKARERVRGRVVQ